MSVTVYGKLKILLIQNTGCFFSINIKNVYKNAFCRRESPSVSDSPNSVII